MPVGSAPSRAISTMRLRTKVTSAWTSASQRERDQRRGTDEQRGQRRDQTSSERVANGAVGALTKASTFMYSPVPGNAAEKKRERPSSVVVSPSPSTKSSKMCALFGGPEWRR